MFSYSHPREKPRTFTVAGLSLARVLLLEHRQPSACPQWFHAWLLLPSCTMIRSILSVISVCTLKKRIASCLQIKPKDFRASFYVLHEDLCIIISPTFYGGVPNAGSKFQREDASSSGLSTLAGKGWSVLDHAKGRDPAQKVSASQDNGCHHMPCQTLLCL